MKKRNKLVSLLLTFAMILTMMVNIVVAENPAPTSKITISNATVGKTYSIYKVFSVETLSDGNVYTVSSEKWEELVTGDGKPFIVIDDNGTVELKANEDVVAFFNGLVERGETLPTATASAVADAATVVFDNLDAGYYYITSTTGSVVSLINAGDVEIIDKNQKPTWEPSNPDGPYYPDPEDPDDPTKPDPDKPYDPYDPSNPDNPDNPVIPGDPDDGKPDTVLPPLGKFVQENGEWVKANDAAIGETLPFMINFYAPRYVGTNEILAYTITDNYGDAFTSVGNWKVSVDGTEVENGAAVINNVDKGFFKVVLNMDKIVAELTAAEKAYVKGNVSITYDAVLSQEATDTNINTASLNWTQVTYDPDKPYDTTGDVDTPDTPDDFDNPGDPDKPNVLYPVDPSDPSEPADPDDPTTIYTPVDPSKFSPDPAEPDGPKKPDVTPNKPNPDDVPQDTKTTTYTYTIDLKKVELGNEDKILDAEFEVRLNGVGDPLTFAYNDNTKTYTLDKEGSETKIKAGSVKIKGLDATTYTFKETTIPAGHTGLEDDEEVTIASVANGNATDTTVNVTIKNPKKGSLLPTTGGVGTTIFYIVGSILVIGAGVLLVSRKRARH